MSTQRLPTGTYDISHISRGSATVETACGGLEIGIAEGTAAWIDANTSFGQIHNSLSPADNPGQSSETAQVRARTSFGDVLITRSNPGQGSKRLMPDTTNAIEVTNLRKGYKGVPVLKDVSFRVERGTVFALLGANGSGKTTTINILTTLIKADGGTATIAGFDVASQPAEVREHISLTGQFAAVDHVLTARENLVLMGDLRHIPDPERTAAQLLERFELNDAADRRLQTFSGGMRRRLDIAMSLIGDAPIIFFDEPTTGLDPQGRTDMWQTIRELADRGTTVFLTTQYLEEADHLADEIAILHGGKIVADGPPDQLKAMVPAGVVKLDFSDPDQLTAAQSALEGRHQVNRVDSKLMVATTGSTAEMADMFIRLRDRKIEPTGFTRQTATLDDVFFKILEEKKDSHASAE